MDTLEHEGITYVKVATLAKKYKYTTDYIGQLCRAGKVDCQLVGRAWFVREESLVNHKSDRYKQTVAAEPLSKVKVFSDDETVEKTAVYPTLSKHAHRHFEDRFGSVMSLPRQHHQSTSPVSSTYFADDSSMHLSVNSNKNHHERENYVPVPTIVDEDVEYIKVRQSVIKPIKLTFSPLPEVTLRGSLSVKSLDTEEKYDPSEPVLHTDFRAEIDDEKSYLAPSFPARRPRTLAHVSPDSFVVQTPQRTSSLVVVPDTSSLLSPIFLPLVIVGSAVCVVCLLSLSSLVESDGLVLKQSWRFNVAQAVTAISFLFENTP